MNEFDKDREPIEPATEEKVDPISEQPPKWYDLEQILTGFKDCPEKQQLIILLAVMGIIGLFLGLLQPNLQLAVEQGQVLAGTVSYPPDNPYYMYQVNAWNLWGQLAGLGLYLGLSELVVSLIFSGLAGIIFFWGAGLWAFTFSKDIRIAVLTPLFLKFIHDTLRFEFGGWAFNYPIMLMGHPHTYGMLGFLFVFLVYPLIANDRYKWAFFLLGMIPAFHLSLGFWAALSVFAAMLWDWKKLVSNLKYVLIGYGLCVVSFLWQRLAYPIDRLESSVAATYLDPYLAYWDGHRYGPLLFPAFGIIVVASVVLVGVMGLLLPKLNLSKGEKFLLRSVVIITGMAVGATLVSQLPLPYVNKISVLLPSRFLNIISLSYVPIFLGLMWQYREAPEMRLILPLSLLILALFYINVLPPFWTGIMLIIYSLVLPLVIIKRRKFQIRTLTLFFVAYVAFVTLIFWGIEILDKAVINLLTFIVASGLIIFWKRTAIIEKKRTSLNLKFGRVSEFTTLLSLVVIAGAVIWGITESFKERLPAIYPVQYDPVLEKVSEGEGLLLISSDDQRYLQLRTGRAVLMEPGALDMLPYSVSSAPAVARILDDIYGIDYFNPPVETRHKGYLAPLDSVQELWAARTSEEWSDLAQQYGFTQVLTSADWELQLPVVIRDDDTALYEIQ